MNDAPGTHAPPSAITRWLACLALTLLCAPLLAGPLQVSVSVLPLQTIVESIGGKHVTVSSLVRPGFDPHHYEPTPRQLDRLSRSKLFVRCGLPFENAWMPRIRSANPAMQVIDARNGIELQAVEHDHGHATHHGESGTDHGHHGQTEPAARNALDPHVWTSPPLVRQMASTIRDHLQATDPAHAADYAANHDVFVQRLDELHHDITRLLEPLTQRAFMVFHPAWGYFARTYGLTQVAVEQEGKEPGARTMGSLIEQARQTNIRVIFVQPQFDQRLAAQIAREINGRVVAIDPLAADYFTNMRHVADMLREALQP